MNNNEKAIFLFFFYHHIPKENSTSPSFILFFCALAVVVPYSTSQYHGTGPEPTIECFLLFPIEFSGGVFAPFFHACLGIGLPGVNVDKLMQHSLA